MLFSNIKCLNEIKSTIILYYTQTLRVETFSLAQLLIVYLTTVIKILKWTFWTLPVLSRKGAPNLTAMKPFFGILFNAIVSGRTK